MGYKYRAMNDAARVAREILGTTPSQRHIVDPFELHELAQVPIVVPPRSRKPMTPEARKRLEEEIRAVQHGLDPQIARRHFEAANTDSQLASRRGPWDWLKDP